MTRFRLPRLPRRLLVQAAWIVAVGGTSTAQADPLDANACLESPARAAQVAASDGSMVATLQSALGEVAVPEHVQRIFARLVDASRSGAPREYRLLGYSGPTFTAHAAAPGHVLVSQRVWIDSGVEEADIAAVLAHELAHLKLLHAHAAGCRALKFVDDARWDLGAAVQAVLRVARQDRDVAKAWNAMHQRFELEADAHAVTVLRAAGYPPQALARLLRRLASQSDAQARGGDSATHTHPALAARIEAVERVVVTRY